jgi:type IV pilus assembly protein PilA
MVTGGSADGNGVITIVASANALGGAVTSTTNQIRLVPFVGTASLAGSSAGGKTITEWKCGPSGTNPMDTRYLPGSCKSAS